MFASRSLCLLVVAQTVSATNRCDSVHTPADSRCTGCPPMYNGKLCASTTRYNDQTKASCGCGKKDPVPRDWWTLETYTAALNCKNLDVNHPSLAWCPQQCGSCYELCTTGGTTQGAGTTAAVCRVFKITNRCGDGYRQYPMWCSNEMSWQECLQAPDQCKQKNNTNWYGYSAHFDLQDFHSQISGPLEWDNVEVTFEPVSCSRWKGPSWDCQCAASEASNISSVFTTPAIIPLTTISPEAEGSGLSGLPLVGPIVGWMFGSSNAPSETPTAAPTPLPAIATIPAQTPSSVVGADHDAFCCLNAGGDACGMCAISDMAGPANWCGKSEENCGKCGAQAAWCPASSGKKHETMVIMKKYGSGKKEDDGESASMFGGSMKSYVWPTVLFLGCLPMVLVASAMAQRWSRPASVATPRTLATLPSTWNPPQDASPSSTASTPNPARRSGFAQILSQTAGIPVSPLRPLV